MRRSRPGWLVLIAALGLGYALFAHWLNTAAGSAALGRVGAFVPWFYYLQHLAMFAALAAWFGASLRPGQVALVTRFALAAGDHLDGAGLAYTRAVTLAWAGFSAAMATASTLLFFLAPLELWSVFANLLSLPLVGAMFAAEFAVRLRLHPDLCQGGVLRSVRAYWERNASHSPGPR